MTKVPVIIPGDSPSGIYALVQTTLQETNKQAIQLESLSKDVRGLIEQVSGMATILRGPGNGERGIVWRMSMLEQASSATREDVHEVKKALETRVTEDQRGRWTLTQTVIVAIIGALGLIAGAVISGLLKH